MVRYLLYLVLLFAYQVLAASEFGGDTSSGGSMPLSTDEPGKPEAVAPTLDEKDIKEEDPPEEKEADIFVDKEGKLDKKVADKISEELYKGVSIADVEKGLTTEVEAKKFVKDNSFTQLATELTNMQGGDGVPGFFDFKNFYLLGGERSKIGPIEVELARPPTDAPRTQNGVATGAQATNYVYKLPKNHGHRRITVQIEEIKDGRKQVTVTCVPAKPKRPSKGRPARKGSFPNFERIGNDWKSDKKKTFFIEPLPKGKK